MKTAILTRTETSDEGTFGTISIDEYSFITGELPWRDNEPEFSCIPVGRYLCTYSESPKFKKRTYALAGVRGRSDVRIHVANYMGERRRNYACEVEGCIGLGKLLGELNGQKALLKSNWAVASFEALMEGQDFMLEIRNGGELLL